MFVAHIFLSKVKVKIEAISERILGKWDYSYNKKSFTSKNVLLQSNLETRSKIHINLYIMTHPFSMLIIID